MTVINKADEDMLPPKVRIYGDRLAQQNFWVKNYLS